MPSQKFAVRLQVIGTTHCHGCRHTRGHRKAQRIGDRRSDCALDCQQVGYRESTIIGCRPQMFVAADIDQLRIDANLVADLLDAAMRSEEHTSELQSLMRISYAVFCLKKKNT